MVEIIPKPPEEIPLWKNLIFYFSIALLIAVILSYFYLDNLQRESLALLKNLEQTLSQDITPEDRTIKNEVLKYRDKINNFSKLFNEHKMVSKFFDALEGLFHPKAELNELSLNTISLEASLSGITESFQTLGQQLIILRDSKKFTNVDLSRVSIGKRGKIEFELSISLGQQILK